MSTNPLQSFSERMADARDRAVALAASGGATFFTVGQIAMQTLLAGMIELEQTELAGSQKRAMLASALKEVLLVLLPVVPISGMPGWVMWIAGFLRPVLRQAVMAMLADLIVGAISGAKKQLVDLGVIDAQAPLVEPPVVASPTDPEPEEPEE